MAPRFVTVENDLADIKELMKVFCRQVTEGVPAYISFEFRDGALKYYHNNAETTTRQTT